MPRSSMASDNGNMLPGRNVHSDNMAAMHGSAAAATAAGQSVAGAASSAMSASPWDGSGSAQHYSAVYDLSVRFLENVQHWFGEHSQQAGISLDTLGGFKAGNIAKSQAYATIVHQLGDNEDLKQQLHAVLQHENARWHPDDFQGQVPVAAKAAASPGFMQPEHHPQMRMPSISSLWSPDMYSQPMQPTMPSINPAWLQGSPQMARYGLNSPLTTPQPSEENQSSTQGHFPHGFSSSYSTQFDGTPPSSVPTMRNPFSGHDHYPISSIKQTLAFPSYEGQVQTLSPTHSVGAFQTRRSLSRNEGWNGNGLFYGRPLAANSPPLERFQHQYSSPALTHRESPLESVSPRDNLAHQTPFILGDSMAMPLGQPSLDMPPPPKATKNEAKPQGKGNERESNRGCSRKDESHPLVPGQRIPQAERPFIHGICKKGFTTRHGVKKHHWGSTTEDPNTTHGCWFKNGKPDIAWDDHPSCKEPATNVRAGKPAQLAKPLKSMKSSDIYSMAPFKLKAPVVPSMIASHPGSLPGFPTLEDLPYKVAESLQATPPPMPPSPVARDNLDTLLTAVNVASKIEAPIPQFQGRNDSVISHLDAQVTAAEGQPYPQAPWSELSPDYMRALSGQLVPQPTIHTSYPSFDVDVLSTCDDFPSLKNADSLRQELHETAGPRMGLSAIATPSEAAQGEQDNDPDTAASASAAKAKRRNRSVISKRELQMLMDSSPGPNKKRLKV